MILCAIGAHFSNSNNAKCWYYEKSLSIIPDFIEIPTIESLKGIVLLVSYEMCAGFMHRVWHHMGIALRSISLLGLDTDPDYMPEINGKSWIEKESIRVLYWNLYVYDLCK